MPYTELEKLNFRACCQLIATHGKSDILKTYARAGMHMNDDEQIIDQCQYILSNMQYERMWLQSKFTPKEARLTLKHMIMRGKHL